MVPQCAKARVQPRLRSSLPNRQGLRDLAQGEISEVVEHDDGTLIGTQLGEGVFDRPSAMQSGDRFLEETGSVPEQGIEGDGRMALPRAQQVARGS